MTYKYIRFKLPMAPGEYGSDRLQDNMTKIALQWIQRTLAEWSEQHSKVEYTMHLRYDAVYVEFERASVISEFLLTWKPKSHSTGWTRISVTESMDYRCYEPYVLSDEVGYLEDMLASDLVTSTVGSTVKP